MSRLSSMLKLLVGKSGQLVPARPNSAPYISGDGFRAMAQHIYDETIKFTPRDVRADETLFVKTDLLRPFFDKIHPKIQYSYTLITHNSDIAVDEQWLPEIDDKIRHWYAQNLTVRHPKMSVIPIGFENEYRQAKSVPALCQRICTQKIRRRRRILFGFSTNTNPSVRCKAIEELRRSAFADEITETLDKNAYLNLLHKYCFVASPPGNGVDCHRTWEAIALGVIPVCLKSTHTELLQESHAPIIGVDSYADFNPTRIEPDPRFAGLEYWTQLIANAGFLAAGK